MANQLDSCGCQQTTQTECGTFDPNPAHPDLGQCSPHSVKKTCEGPVVLVDPNESVTITYDASGNPVYTLSSVAPVVPTPGPNPIYYVSVNEVRMITSSPPPIDTTSKIWTPDGVTLYFGSTPLGGAAPVFSNITVTNNVRFSGITNALAYFDGTGLASPLAIGSNLSISGGFLNAAGGGGTGTWGSIGGILTDQTDLATALSLRVQTSTTINGHPLSGNVVLTNADVGLINVANVTQEPAIAPGTVNQYWRGDKTWQNLNASAIGLGSVINSLQLTAANNLSDLTNATTARTNLGMGNVQNIALSTYQWPYQTLKTKDSDNSNALTIYWADNDNADRALGFSMGSANRVISLSGSPTLDNWFDQNVKSTGTPQFSRLGLGASASLTYPLYVSGSSVLNGQAIIGTNALISPAKLEVVETNALISQTSISLRGSGIVTSFTNDSSLSEFRVVVAPGDLALAPGGVDRLKILNSNGNTTISSTTDSTSVSTGSLSLGGGLGVAKNITAPTEVLNTLFFTDNFTTGGASNAIFQSSFVGTNPRSISAVIAPNNQKIAFSITPSTPPKADTSLVLWAANQGGGGVVSASSLWFRPVTASSDLEITTVIGDSDRGDIVLRPQLTEIARFSQKNSRITFGSGYQVGVGTASPAYALDVNGDVNIASGSHFKINGVNLVFSGSGFPVNVRDYGAVGDGSHDDTANILAAIAACPSSHAALYFPSGTYKTSHVVLSGKSDWTVYGDGIGASIIKASSPSKVLSVTNGDHVNVHGLTLDGSCVARTAGQQAFNLSGSYCAASYIEILNSGEFSCSCGYDSATDHISLDHINIHGGFADGVNLNTVATAMLSNITVDAADDDLLALGVCTDVIVNGFFGRARTDLGTAWGRGIAVFGGSDILLANIFIDTTKQSGIWLNDESGSGVPTRVTFSNVKLVNAAKMSGHGMYIKQSTDCVMNKVVIENPGTNGVYAPDCVYIECFTNLVFKDCTFGTNFNQYCRGIHTAEGSSGFLPRTQLTIKDCTVNMLGAGNFQSIYMICGDAVTHNWAAPVTDLVIDDSLANQVPFGAYLQVDYMAGTPKFKNNTVMKSASYVQIGNGWVTSHAYVVNECVVDPVSNLPYRCAIAHTSGTFATDLAAGKWVLIRTFGND